MSSRLRIGIDFDNTLVSYDDVFRGAARSRGLIDESFSGTKQAVRDRIRLLPDGEIAWQTLQGHVYGKGIDNAVMFEGADTFLRRCRVEGCSVFVVSHKTEFGHYDPAKVNLRRAALDWMAARGFFRADGYGIPIENVFFEGTRDDKVARISNLRCTHFIDDLEEVLTDSKFPSDTTRILFSEARRQAAATPYLVRSTWREIEESVFDGRA
jgi:hypothetical protein